MATVTIKVREFVGDVRSSLSKVTLQRKYGVSETGLQRVLDKLVDKGLLTLSDVAGCQWYEPTTKEVWVCPACRKPQAKVWEVCPVCGVIVSRFEPKPRIRFHEESRAEKPSSAGQFFRSIATNFSLLGKDGLFWTVLLFAMLPLMLTMPDVDARIILNSLLAGAVWAVVFKKLLVRDHAGWAVPISAMLFTGFTGVGLLLASYYCMPQWIFGLKRSPGSLASLSGWVLQVGLCEELCKALPAFFYIHWKSLREEEIEPRTLVIITVFSAIGFAATENVSYAFKVASEVSAFGKKVADGAAASGVKVAMLNYMGRAVSCVFGHAVLSGIFGCFLALAAHSRRFRLVLFLVGLILSAGLHGLYDWLVDKQMVLAALTDGLAFIIFYTLVMTPAPRENSDGKPMKGLNYAA